MLVVFAPHFFVVYLPNLTRICLKHFMFLLFKFVIFGVLHLRHLIRLKFPDFLMVFIFCLIIPILFLFWHLFRFSTILSYADIFFRWLFDIIILVLIFLLIFYWYSLILRFSSILVE